MPVVDTKFELCCNAECVLKIGRDYQNKDGFRGAHYDTVKLLCDTIEYLRDKLPKPDQNWEAICAKCMEGEIEPKDCEYYGEPNGCNSPIYGQRPQSAPVGNAAAMREALEEILEKIDKWRTDNVMEHWQYSQLFDIANWAIAKPPRNCDLYNDVEDSWQDYKQFRGQTGEAIYFDMVHFWPFAKWLFAPATERKGETDGR